MNPTKVDALHSLCPGADWVLRDDDLEWLDAKQTQPSAAEIEAQRQNQQKASSQFDALLKEKKNKQSKGDAFMDL